MNSISQKPEQKPGPWWASGKRNGIPTPAPWRCPACATANIASARFCGGCGRLTSLAGTLAGRSAKPKTEIPAGENAENPVQQYVQVRPQTTGESSTLSSASEPQTKDVSNEIPVVQTDVRITETSDVAEPETLKVPEPISETPRKRHAKRSSRNSKLGRSDAKLLSPHATRPGASMKLHIGTFIQKRFRLWFGRRIGMGVFILFFLLVSMSSVVMLSGFGVRTVTRNAISRPTAGRVLFWNDFRGTLSSRLGLTAVETDEMARLALGGKPSGDRIITRADVRAIAAWLGTIRGVPTSLISAPAGDGPMTTSDLNGESAASPRVCFSDLPVDHPVYQAWSALLAIGVTLADARGAARPGEPVQWEEWGSICRAVSSAKLVQMPEILKTRRGPMSPDEAVSALADAAACLGRAGKTLPNFVSPSRFEVFAALSLLLEQGAKG
ncbi:MAG: zinc ribbon domain-containing protein [Candidatus Ozemobacteraceae bacterium]